MFFILPGRRRPLAAALLFSAVLLAALLPAAAHAQHQLPGAVSLEWQDVVSETTWGFEYPLAVDQSADALFVASGRIASPYTLSAYETSGDLRWRHETPIALGTSLAVALDGSLVYALGYDTEEPEFRRALLLAFNALTGELAWKSYFTSWSGTAKVQPANDLILSGDGTTVFMAGQENEFGATIKGYASLGAYDAATGEARWIRRFAPPVDNKLWSMDRLRQGEDFTTVFAAGGSGSLASPELLVTAVEASTGFSRWERVLPAGRVFDLAVRPGSGELAVAGESAAGAPDLHVLDPGDGATQWSVLLSDALIAAAYSADGSRLVVNGIQDGSFPGAQLDQLTTYGLKATGGVQWSRGFAAPWGQPGGIDFDPEGRSRTLAHSPTSNTFVVGGSRQPEGAGPDLHLVAYGGNTGAVLWSDSVDVSPAQSNQRLNAIDIDPSGQRLALLGDDADALDLQSVRVGLRDVGSGSALTDVTIEISSAAADTPLALALSDTGTRVYQLTQTNFGKYRVSGHAGQSGATVWSTTLEVAGTGYDGLPPAIATDRLGDRVFLQLPQSEGGELMAFDGASGTELWSRASPRQDGPVDTVAKRILIDSEDAQAFLGGLSPAGGLEVQCYSYAGDTLWLVETQPGSQQDEFGGIDRSVLPSGAELLVLGGIRTGGAGSVGPQDRRLVMALYDSMTGAELWSRAHDYGDGYVEMRDIALSKNGLWIATQIELDGPSGTLVTALHSAVDGKELWRRASGSTADPRRGMGLRFAVQDQLVVAGSRVGAGTVADDVLMEAVFSINGALSWSQVLDSGSGDDLGAFEVDADGLIVVGTGTRGLHSPVAEEVFTFGLDAISGQGLWACGYDSPLALGAPLLDDAGRALAISADGNALLASYRVWGGAGSLSDSLLVRYRMPRLTGSVEGVSASAGGSQELSLRQPLRTLGDLYLIVGSAHGKQPGLVLDGQGIPLAFDGYSIKTIELANQGPFFKTLGLSDIAGRATARIDVPPGMPSSLVGATLHHAFVTIDVGGTWGLSFASNAMPLTLGF